MDEGANQVAAASGEISSSSQSLAEGASEQAASIEQTSSSLEEIRVCRIRESPEKYRFFIRNSLFVMGHSITSLKLRIES